MKKGENEGKKEKGSGERQGIEQTKWKEKKGKEN